MFTGWGVRTLSSRMAAYNPISYHNGSIWPHDTAIIAAGLAAYGFRQEASRLIRGVLEAAAHFPDHRLPELFAGFSREEDDFPVEYPQANAPQAWAAGAVIMMTQTWLGINLSGDRLRTRPLPESPSIDWQDVPFRECLARLTGGRSSAGPIRQIA
jgi:glycogen debranching enzyme